MPRINEHALAVRVCKLEGKRIEVNIAQVKEVIRCVLDELSQRDPDDVLDLMGKHLASVEKAKK